MSPAKNSALKNQSFTVKDSSTHNKIYGSGSPKVHKHISHKKNMPFDIDVSIFHPQMQMILIYWNFGII
jgi:hypothetical protein